MAWLIVIASQRQWNKINPAAAPRMAATDSPNTEPKPFDSSMPNNRLAAISRASWIITTSWRHHRTDPAAINLNQG